jgi:hypothetical protein
VWQDESDESVEGDLELPVAHLATVTLGKSARSRHVRTLRHWCSTTPEVQVLSLDDAHKARGWLTRQGVLGPDDVSHVTTSLPLLQELMMSDAADTLPL